MESTHGARGLTAAEAAQRFREDGPNELPTTARHGFLHLLRDVLREPMLLMLVVAGALYIVIGEPLDATMLMASVFVIIGITIVQERRTENAIDALRDLSNPATRVQRDGEIVRIASREVVVGDIVLVGEGDRVPADTTVHTAINLSVDESLLTGESVAVRKQAHGPTRDRSGDTSSHETTLLAGTLVTTGHAEGRVTATGTRSTLGRIGRDLASINAEPTSLQRETAKNVRRFATIGIGACIVVALWYWASRGADLVALRDGVLAGIAMAMGILPEEFPVVMTVFLALGAWRISRSNVLTRRMPAIESLGAATVLCVDKTGTLTRNRMTARWLVVDNQVLDLAGDAPPSGAYSEAVHLLLEHAILACRPDAFDPMDRALIDAGVTVLGGTEHLHPEWSLVREYPLATDRLAVVHVWVPAVTGSSGGATQLPSTDRSAPLLMQGEGGTGRGSGSRARGRLPIPGAVVVAKGAVEAILDLCHLPTPESTSVLAQTKALASTGVRVLGIAVGPVRTGVDSMPEDPHDLAYTFLGLVGFEDPIRPMVPSAVAECQAAGVRVVMITGDYPETARSIATQAGIAHADRVLSGAELSALSDPELSALIGEVAVFARVVPEQKLRIVRVLQARGDVVAMTGDGVNDAPALKAAQIGIAMGGRGTDVAREAADLVLLDDDFSSIVGAIRLGRRIYDNIRKAIVFIFAVHVPIIGLSMIPVLKGDWPLLLMPLHIVFLEFVIDPSCTLVFEAEAGDPESMRRPPRNPATPLFAGSVIAFAVAQGSAILGACLWTFWQAHGSGMTDGQARALTFACLVTGFIGVIVTNRSWSEPLHRSLTRPNTAFWWVLGGGAGLLFLAVGTSVGQRLLHFDAPDPASLTTATAWSVAVTLVFELSKRSPRVRNLLVSTD
jgi:Ca2+-transporting ATPase